PLELLQPLGADPPGREANPVHWLHGWGRLALLPTTQIAKALRANAPSITSAISAANGISAIVFTSKSTSDMRNASKNIDAISCSPLFLKAPTGSRDSDYRLDGIL